MWQGGGGGGERQVERERLRERERIYVWVGRPTKSLHATSTCTIPAFTWLI